MDNLLDTTERVCPECNGNLRNTGNRYKETHWTCKQCRLIFAVPKSKADNVVEIFKTNHEIKIKYLKTV